MGKKPVQLESLVPLVSFAGFVYPDMWINGKIEQRQKDVIMAMPFSVDMMALSVEAGLDFAAAITKVTEKAKKLYSQAFNKLEKAYKSDKKNPDVLNYMGFTSRKIGNFENVYYARILRISTRFTIKTTFFVEFKKLSEN